MKKIAALLLVLCMSIVVFVSCGDSAAETTAPETSTAGTTFVDGSTTAETTAPVETIFPATDPQIIDSLDYDYTIRTVLDENQKVVGVSIWKYKGSPETITFDSSYVLNGVTYPICEIGSAQGILDFPQTLKSVTIPASVKKISDRAFNMCGNLTELNLSEGLESIGTAAFWFCKSLESVTLPSTLKSIGKTAFGGCSSLKSIVIPASVETIEINAFSACASLESITIPRRFESQIAQIFGETNATITYID